MKSTLLGCALIAASASAFADVRVVIPDIDYMAATDYADNKDKLDLYLPGGEGPHPVIYFIHGGGLLAGDKSTYDFVGKFFASHGYATAVVNHRLSPGVAHPAHIEDIAASFAWVHENIAERGGDADQIFVVGHSAGAYLAGLLALDAKYLAKHGLGLESIAGAAPISGFYHVDRLAPGRPKTVWGENENDWLDASPANHVRDAAPPMLLIYADGDVPERRQESEDLANELRKAGHKAVNTLQIADRDHRSIVRKLGSDGDATAAAILDFAEHILRERDGKSN